jgi:FMN reductase
MISNSELQTPIRVAGICGSLSPGSHTRAALRVALRRAQEMGAETQLIDLRDYELAFCCEDENYHAQIHRPESHF